MPEVPGGLLADEASALLGGAVPGGRVAECVLRTGGQLSMVSEARFAGGAEPVIIKVYAPEWKWKQAKEAHVYGLLRNHGFGPVARILRTGRAPGGRACTIMTCLPGEPLSEASARMTAGEIAAVDRQLGSGVAGLDRLGRR